MFRKFESRRGRLMAVAAAVISGAAVSAAALASGAHDATLEVTITGVKSNKGVVRLALCPAQAAFPDCKDKVVRSAALPISGGTARTVLTGLPPGSYAVSVFHDANANGKLDTFVGIPKEGYGFSRNPPFKPRAPKFSEAQVEVSGAASAAIKLRYIL